MPQQESESDSDHPDDLMKEALKKRIDAIRRKCRRDRAKSLAEKNFLCHKTGRKVKSITSEFPDIGRVVEEYVQERSVGADAWRRTGMLTFDGNKAVKEKVTFSRIQEYLQSVYKRKFSYGTVVQLCVARNRRHRSASRYKGVAQVTCRRARKGFQLRYNPDNHWSAAMYRGLSHLQYKDGSNVVNIS